MGRTEIKNHNKRKHDYLFRIIFLGDSNVWKTSSLFGFVKDVFYVDKKDLDSDCKYINIKDKIIKLI